MAIKEELNKTDKKLEKVENTLEELNQKSIAMQVLQFSKEQNKQLNDNFMATNTKMFIALLVSLIMNVVICGGFFYYETHYTNQVTDEIADTDGGGNACIGDNCNNGDVEYGESEKKNN
jgi:hypothetical protein